MSNTVLKTISSYLDVSSGRSFRGAIKSSENSTHKVIQIGDVQGKDNKLFIDFGSLIETEIKTSREVTCLEKGQVLIVAKGNDKHVVLLDIVPKGVVCTQHFLVLTPKSDTGITPEFIYYYLSSGFSKNWMQSNAGGSYQSSLSKATLEKMPFPDLSTEQQKVLTDLSISVECEVELHQKMIATRKAQLSKAFERISGEIQ